MLQDQTPSIYCPFIVKNLPFPSMLLSTQIASNFYPFDKVNIPLPFLLSFLNSPSYDIQYPSKSEKSLKLK